MTEEENEREKLVKEFYENKVKQLNSQIEIADNKAVEYFTSYEKTEEELKR